MLVWFIYALVDPETSAVRYVGHTCNPTQRFWHHLVLKSSATSKWIAALKTKALKPKFEILEFGTDERRDDAERKWIAHYRALGAPIAGKYEDVTRLLNIENGGSDARKVVESSREKMRLAKLGKKQSPEMIERRRAGLAGHVVSPETREKIAASKRGKPRDAATRAKLSAATRAHHERKKEKN